MGETIFNVASDSNLAPPRDEILIELSVLLGQVAESTCSAYNSKGIKLTDAYTIEHTVHQNIIKALTRAIAYVRAST